MNRSFFLFIVIMLGAVMNAPSQHADMLLVRDSLRDQVMRTEELIKEQEGLMDSLSYYKQRMKYQYLLKKGKPYSVEYDLGKWKRILYYRIAEVDPDNKGKDTIFVGARTIK